MAQLIPMSRAARLVGVKRGTLQKKIRDGELATFEGMIELNELMRCFPYAKVEDDTMLERMEHIIERASSRARSRPTALPDTETLAARLATVSRQLANTSIELDRYKALTQRIERKLIEMERDASATLPGFRTWFFGALQAQVAPSHTPERFFVEDTFLRIIAAHVRIQPSGHDFFVEGTDTLLDAGLRAGLALPYGCSNGNCGRCKARVIEGQVQKVRHYDYVLSAAEQSRGYTLMCCHTAVTDLVIETPEAKGAADMPTQSISARVRKIEPLGSDVLLLHLRTPRTDRLRFLAGQRAALSFHGGLRAEFPIASCPCDDMNLQFHVPRTPGEPVSDYAFNRLRINEQVVVDGPRGAFVLDEDSSRSLLFIAWDTGFAPIKSLVEHAMSADSAEHIYLYWIVSSAGGHYLGNLCRAWSDALENFSYVPLEVAKTHGVGGQKAVAEHLERIVSSQPTLGDLEIYTAGPETLVRVTEQALRAAGATPTQLHSEAVPVPTA